MMRRVCILKDLGREWGIVLGEGFTPTADEIRKLTAARVLKGVRKVTSGSAPAPFDPDRAAMNAAVTGWAARYPERVDPAAVQWEIVDLAQVGRTDLPAKAPAAPKSAAPSPLVKASPPPPPPAGKVVTPPVQKGAKLADVLTSAATAAAREGLRPFVYFFADWCPPCRMLRQSLTHPLMVEAFRGTYVVQLKIDDWELQATAAGLDVSAVPVFFRLDPTGRSGDMVSGDAWGANTPENMSGPLGAFFRKVSSVAPVAPAAPTAARAESGRDPRSEGTAPGVR